MIKYIVETVSSLTDTNGNRYHFATVTSVRTGNMLVIDSVGGDSNAGYLVRKLLGLDFSQVHCTNNSESIRQFNRMVKHNSSGLYEHQVTAAMLRKLAHIPVVNQTEKRRGLPQTF